MTYLYAGLAFWLVWPFTWPLTLWVSLVWQDRRAAAVPVRGDDR